MAIYEQICKRTDNQKILDFCTFVLSGVSDGDLPDYNHLDMMQVPGLVPNIFVHDYRHGFEDGFLIKFSGTKLDENYGQSIQGKRFQDTYSGDDAKEKYIPLHYESIERKKPFLAIRTVLYDGGFTHEKYRLSTTVFFPCSSDQETVNFAIGMVLFEPVSDSIDPVYTIIGDAEQPGFQ